MQDVTWSGLFAALDALSGILWPWILIGLAMYVVWFYTLGLPSELSDILKELKAIREALEKKPALEATALKHKPNDDASKEILKPADPDSGW